LQNKSEILDAVRSKEEKMIRLQLELQPYIIAVEEDCAGGDRFYIVFNDIRFVFEDIFEAVINCFELFYTLHLKYPPECEQVWQIIAKV
jgi:hypothetical protein